MNDKQPKDPLYPRGLEEAKEIRNQILEDFKKPTKKEQKDELTPLKKLNHKIGVYLSPKTTDISDDEKKRKIGVIITTLIVVTLIISSYYFLIYEPSQEELSLAKTTKLNELHDLYSGALTTSPNAIILENKIANQEQSLAAFESHYKIERGRFEDYVETLTSYAKSSNVHCLTSSVLLCVVNLFSGCSVILSIDSSKVNAQTGCSKARQKGKMNAGIFFADFYILPEQTKSRGPEPLL